MKKLVFFIILMTTLSLQAPELSDKDKEKKELNKQDDRDLNYLMESEFSEENLLKLLNILGVTHAEEAVKQSKLETGWFSSRLFTEHNNLFGMHFPRVRDTYAHEYTIADNGRKVASYRSWVSSVLDFVLYLDYYKSLGYSTDNYHQFLVDVGYCEKGAYYIKLLKMIS